MNLAIVIYKQLLYIYCYIFFLSGQITLVCLGPLTNLALALRLDPQVGKKLKNVYILGGNIEGESTFGEHCVTLDTKY